MNRDTLTRLSVFLGLLAVAVGVRLSVPWPSFGAVTAATLFAGFYFRHRATAMCLPLLAMMLSDLFLEKYETPLMLAVYLGCLIPIAWSGLLRNKLTPVRVGATTVASSLLYFIVTNAAVWYVWYPRDWAGLANCYAQALPFLVNALVGDLLFSTCFFGAYAVSAWLARAPIAAELHRAEAA